MKYLGIDFGSKKIGLAKSDELGMIAYPWQTIDSTKNNVENIFELVRKEEIDKIIIGWSLDQKGIENVFQKKVQDFINLWKEKTNIPVVLQDERFSSVSVQQMHRWSEKDIKRKSSLSDDHSQSAAVILQRFLESVKNKNNYD